MLPGTLVIATSLAYLMLLFAVAAWADRRRARGKSVIGNAWVYALSMAVYCTAWTYFGSVGRAATAGVWFLPIYLGPMLAMLLGWMVLRKMIRIARTQRITTIADFIASRYGKSAALAGLVTLITVVGIVPYIALQLKAIASGYAVLTALPGLPGQTAGSSGNWLADSTLLIALAMAGFTMVFGARQLDGAERHEGMVAAIAFESVVKLLAFVAVGVFVCWGLFNGPGDIFARARAVPELARLLTLGQGQAFAYEQWFALTLLAMLSVLFLPRQFQVMVVENVDERHLKRAVWVFPLYLLLINLFVLPIALGGLLLDPGSNPETFVLTLPLVHGAPALALLAFVGGLSAATGMVIVEAIAVSTMVCNDLVMPLLLRTRRFAAQAQGDLTALLLNTRRAAIVLIMLLGYVYFRLAGEAYALVSIGLISFAAVAQFAPALLGGLYWRGGTRAGALAGLLAGFALWAYTLMLPSVAKSGWLAAEFLQHGPFGIALLKPEQLFGLQGLDNLTHALFWSLTLNAALFVAVSLWRLPSARERSQALLFVDVFERDAAPTFWRGHAELTSLRALCERLLGSARTQRLFEQVAARQGRAAGQPPRADAALVRDVETQLAGSIGSASARVMVAAVVDEEPLGVGDVMQLVEEGSQLRAANEQLRSLDQMKDDFMSSVTHELRTPLTSIRAMAELMVDEPDMAAVQRSRFTGLIVTETERLTRLVNQVLELAKIESSQAAWRLAACDLNAIAQQAAAAMAAPLAERGTVLTLALAAGLPSVMADPDRLMQVLLNLLSNAAKFVPAPGGRITLALHATPDAAVFSVSDNGPGVPLAQQALIFEKFRQGGDASQPPVGTGLGLPISRQIVRHFGGRLWLESSPGAGATFRFTLPWQDAGATS